MTTRFAFYSRIRTKPALEPSEHVMDRLARERAQARALAQARGGQIVTEYLDTVGRSVPWADRPQAAKLLTALTDKERGFAAIILDPGDAFAGDGREVLTAFAEAEVQIWTLSFDEPLSLDNPAHVLYLRIFAGVGDPARPHDRKEPLDFTSESPSSRGLPVEPISVNVVLATTDRILARPQAEQEPKQGGGEA